MDPASIVAFIGFGAQVVGVIQQILSFVSAVHDAPSSVRDLVQELQILENIILVSPQDEKTYLDTSPGAWKAYQKALGAVDEQCRALLRFMEEALPGEGAGRTKRVWRTVNFVFKEEKFAKLVEGLERGKSSLHLAQLSISNEANASSNRLLLQANSHLFKITQAIMQSGQQSNISDTTVDTWKFFSLVTRNTAHEIAEDDSDEAERSVVKRTPESGGITNEFDDREQSVEHRNKPSNPIFPATKLLPSAPSTSELLSDKKHEHVNVLQSRTDITMFHNRILGTVLVSRRKAVAKTWNDEDRRYEKQNQSFQTIIRVRPAPWLLSKGYEIRFEELLSRYGGSSWNISLEASRYVPIKNQFEDDLFRLGNLSGLQHVLEKGIISIKDRDQFTQKNLLELSMSSLGIDWLFAEMDSENGERRRGIVQMSRWLVTQGLTYDFTIDPDFFNDWFFLCPSQDKPKNEIAAEMYELECLLLEGTDNAPCLPRAAALILFVMVNEEHSRQLHCTIQDLITEAAVDQEAGYFAEKERVFWSKVKDNPSDIYGPGMENVIASSMLQLAKPVKGDEATSRRKALKGSRRILCRLFDVIGSKAIPLQDMPLPTRDEDATIYSRILVLCRNMNILDDGFGEHFTNLACAHQCLDIWLEGLCRARYNPEPFLSSHLRASESEEHSLEVRDGGNGVCSDSGECYGNGSCKRHAHNPARMGDDFFDSLDRASRYYTELEEVEEALLIAELPKKAELRHRVAVSDSGIV